MLPWYCPPGVAAFSTDALRFQIVSQNTPNLSTYDSSDSSTLSGSLFFVEAGTIVALGTGKRSGGGTGTGICTVPGAAAGAGDVIVVMIVRGVVAAIVVVVEADTS